MSFTIIFENDVNFNFQINRLLSYGEEACKKEEVYEAAQKIHDVPTWYTAWREIAEIAEAEARYVHSMYYYRMAEFMLTDDHPAKNIMYQKMQDMFQQAFPTIKRHEVPFKHGFLPCIYLQSHPQNKTILLHGGYDSFIEEFYLFSRSFSEQGYNIILFEGEGQGATLRQGMAFNEQWENSVTAILDYFKLEEVALIGVSWGGYFALRAAAFEKRITHVVCFDACYDGLDVQFNLIKQPFRIFFRLLYHWKCKSVINALVRRKMRHDNLANWGISHGMDITQTDSPYNFYQAIEKHNLRNILHHIDQDVLLLAGEKDHYIPLWQFNYLSQHLPEAQVTSRLFTKAEGGEQHCRVGNYEVALDTIYRWLKENY